MPFTGNIAELPGFFPPESIKLDDRIFSNPDGSVEFEYLPFWDQDKILPEQQIDVSWTSGPEIIVLCTLHSSLLFVREQPSGHHAVICRIPRDVVYFWPGSYRLNGYDLPSGKEVFTKSLVIRSTPRMVTSAVPSLIRYSVGYGFTSLNQPAPPEFTGWPFTHQITQTPPTVDQVEEDPRWVVVDGVRRVPIVPGTLLGNGSPEGVVVADIRKRYVDMLTGKPWVKVMYSGQNTGWQLAEPVTGVGVIPPRFLPTPGTYYSAQTVALVADTVGSVMYLTTDGSQPTINSTLYEGTLSIPFPGSLHVKAIAYKDGVASPVAEAHYEVIDATIPRVATPVLNPPGGDYNVPQAVSVIFPTPGSSGFYTTNNSTPTSSSTPYTGPIPVTISRTLRVLATLAGYRDSIVAIGNYNITTSTVTLPVYWGFSTKTMLDEADIIALQNVSLEMEPYRDYPFVAGSTNQDFFFWWWSDEFPPPSEMLGFTMGGLPVSLAAGPQGFGDGPINGWPFKSKLVGGMSGKLWRSFYPLGGGTQSSIVRVQ